MRRLVAADVVILPLAGEGKALFPADSIELLRDIREALPDRSIEIAAGDDDYREFGLHSSLLDLGSWLVSSVLIPLIPNILWDLIKKRTNLFQDTRVKLRITIAPSDPDAAGTCVEYEGRAEDVPLVFGTVFSSRVEDRKALPAAAASPAEMEPSNVHKA